MGAYPSTVPRTTVPQTTVHKPAVACSTQLYNSTYYVDWLTAAAVPGGVQCTYVNALWPHIRLSKLYTTGACKGN